MATPNPTTTCPIRRILKGDYKDDSELASLRADVTVAEVKVGVTNYLEDMEAHTPPAHLTQMFTARKATLKTVLAVLGHGEGVAQVTEDEA